MSIHSKGQNPKTWKPSEEIFVSALELVLASLTLVLTPLTWAIFVSDFWNKPLRRLSE